MRVLYMAAALACSAALAAPAVARPGAPAPRSGPTSPPPAWVESSGSERWLLFSSYCWTKKGARPVASCVDFIPPTMRPDLPRIVLTAGERVRLNLGFRPTALSVTVGGRSYRLPASATAVWRVRAPGGVAMLSARGGGGGASYVARFVIRPAPAR
jgi:hypothetical protein